MRGLIGRARQWWRGPGEKPVPAVPYEIACCCGQVARGFRQARHQVLPCPGCGRPLFILPLSPYLPSEQPRADAAGAGARPFALAMARKPWALPLLAATVTLLGVILAYALILRNLGRDGSTPLPETAEEIRTHVRAGQKALSEGSFQLALEELETARQLRDRTPQALLLGESRRLNQLHREAALLAGLLLLPLQEVLREAAGVRDPQGWQARFRAHYQDRAVIFDDVVRREADGRCSLAVYEVRGDGAPAQLELGEVRLLIDLKERGLLERPQRLVFGARLAGVAREELGVWVVRFRPGSGVLLTDEDALAACAPVPLDDDLREVLRRQAQWAAELP